MIKGIVAVDNYDGIGFENDLLFRSDVDMNHFRDTTTGNIVVMGRRTFESLKFKPLNNRLNIVLSSSLKKENYMYDNLIICHNWKEFISLIAKLDKEDERDIFIMGGGKIYVSMEEYIDEWIVTIFNTAATNVDTYLEVDFKPFEKYKEKDLEKDIKVAYYIREE